MKRLIKRIICVTLLCMLLCAWIFAEAAEAISITDVTSEPVKESKQEAPSEPAENSDTKQEISQPSEEQTEMQEQEPSAEPTEECDPEQSEEPTAEPTDEPTVEPTDEPEPTPVSPNALRIGITGSEPTEDGGRILRYRTEQDAVEITWNRLEAAISYHVEVIAGGEVCFEADTEAARLALAIPDLIGNHDEAAGQQNFTLSVTALGNDGEALAEGSLVLELVKDNDEENRPDRGGFSHGGFSGSFGGKGQQTGEIAKTEQGFRVTPGKALTSTHSNGDMSMRLYGSAEIASTEETVNELCLGNETVMLDNGSSRFIVDKEENVLMLTPFSGGETWSFSAKALKTLNRSGIDTLLLVLDGQSVGIPTAQEMHGEVYANYAALGIVSKDYHFTVSAYGTEISVLGKSYRLNEAYELTEIGG